MNCLLCLQEFVDPLNKINISDNEKDEFISDIIKQHFWLKPEECIKGCLCTECWRILKEFHEFYKRIKQQHTDAVRKRQSMKRAKPTRATNAKKLRVETNSEITSIKRSLRSFIIKEEPQVYNIAQENDIPQENNIAPDLVEEFIKTEPQPEDDAKDPFEAQVAAETTKAKCNMRSDFKQKLERSREHDEFIKAHLRLKCEICDEELENFNVLKTHFRKEHLIRGYAYCCARKFLKRGLLADHLHLHENPKYFACNQCGKLLADRYSMENHKKIRHGEKRERVFKCETCMKSYFSRQIYERHLLSHIPDEKKEFTCTHCQKPFATKALMNDHVNAVHLLLNANICDVCGKLIRGGSTALQRHQEEHNGLPKPPIVCQMCGLTIKTKYGLVRHMKRQHMPENREPRECQYCHKISPSLTAHQYHVKFMHETERKYGCTMCDKAFKRARDLKEHMTTHTGEVLYTCAHCPKTFNSHANMHSHRKKVHRKEWEEARMQKYLKTNVYTV